MICKRCGAAVEDGLARCPQCGAPLTEPLDETAAPSAEPAPVETPPEETPLEGSPAEETPAGGTAEGEKTEPPEAPEKPRRGPVVLLIALGLVAVAAVVLLVTLLPRGGKDKTEDPAAPAAETAVPADETPPQNGAESVTDAEPDGETADYETHTVPNEDITPEMAAAVVARSSGQELTNADLAYYYWNQLSIWVNNYGSYLSLRLDLSQPLAAQAYDEERSWEDFLLDTSIETFHQTSALVKRAEAAGFALNPENAEYLELLPETIADNAATQGLDGADAYLRQLYGPYANMESYTRFVRASLLSYDYLNELFSGIEYTPEDVSAYFDENAERYAEQSLSKDEPNMVNVRHILIKFPETDEADGDGEGEKTDTAAGRAGAREKADNLLAEWQGGDATEESFALLASENSEDPGSAGNGGLYENVYPGEMVAAFNDWCFDEARKPGDTGVVETEYGYHIIYFSGTAEHAHWYEVAENDLVMERRQEILDSVVADEALETEEDKIVIMSPEGMEQDGSEPAGESEPADEAGSEGAAE